MVDDTPENLHLLVEILSNQGYMVRPAPNGKLALSGAQAIPPDLILLDIKMPQMDGYDVCGQLKANEKEVICKRIRLFLTSNVVMIIDSSFVKMDALDKDRII